uniref:Sperm tail PG-rich repeat containing 2 n=1 Tax=Anolis carolinensis TaxID=28377 RepID=A0A803T8F5_ANOCA
MYDRAPRALTSTLGCTRSHLGPGYYDLPSQSRPLRDGFAPFLSLASRGLQTVIQNDEDDIPGPGHYDINRSQKAIKGGGSLQNKEKRFREIRTHTPGPGTYGEYHSMAQDIIKPKRSAHVTAAQKLANSIKIFRKTDAPSIPSQGQGYGYEELDDGTLIRHNPPSRDSTLGPAYYQMNSDETYPTMKYKGVHFGNLTEKRYEFRIHDGPGPGDYDLIPENVAHYENVNIKKEDQKKHDLRVPRYHEVIVLQEEKKGVPGPGQYDIRGQFGKGSSTAQSEFRRAPFLSLSQRFAPVKSATPAPGTYNETRWALESLNKAGKTKNIPFGHTSVRFTQDYRLQKSPGPAFYNILNYRIATEKCKKANLEKKKKGAFGSSVPRLLYLVKREAFSTPGPADYQDAPPPGSYDVQKSYEKSQCKTEYLPPRTLMAKKRHTSFLSGTFRERVSRTEMNLPGPGAYNPEMYHSIAKPSSGVAVWVSRVDRFKDAKDDFPGPGAYELSPLLRDTVLKKTYNITLNNPLLIQAYNSAFRYVPVRSNLLCGLCTPNDPDPKKPNEVVNKS